MPEVTISTAKYVVPWAVTAVGSWFGAEAAKDAAETQANAIDKASAASRAAAEQARAEVLDMMAPAFSNYRQLISDSIGQLQSGETDVFRVLEQSTGAANQILSNAGADAQRAILGADAVTQGIPRQQFEQQYAQAPQGALDQFQPPAAAEPTRGAQSTVPPRGPRQPGIGDFGTGPPVPQFQPTPGDFTGVNQLRPDYTAPPPSAREIMPPFQRIRYPHEDPSGFLAGAIPPTGSTVGQEPGAPQYGFRGAAGQLAQGEQAGLGLLERGAVTGRGDIQAGMESALGRLGATEQQALSLLDRAKTEGIESLNATERSVLQQLAQTQQAGLERYQPYSEAGQAAIGQEAALSGAMGPEAQQAAIDAYIESPGQKYLREQQEQALIRNAAAIGGLGGGSVRTALQEQAFGIASTQQQQALENLRSIASRGQQVAGAEAGLIQGVGQTGAGLTAGLGGQRSGIIEGAGQAGAGITSALGQQAAGTISQASQQAAQLAQQLGISQAQLAQMTAGQQAQLAERTGISLSQIQQAVGFSQSANVAGLGGDLARTRGGAATDISNLLSQQGTTELLGSQNLSAILSNLATQSGSQLSELTAQKGSALAAGQYASGQAIGQALTGLGGIMAYNASNQPPPPPAITQPQPQPTSPRYIDTRQYT